MKQRLVKRNKTYTSSAKISLILKKLVMTLMNIIYSNASLAPPQLVTLHLSSLVLILTMVNTSNAIGLSVSICRLSNFWPRSCVIIT